MIDEDIRSPSQAAIVRKQNRYGVIVKSTGQLSRWLFEKIPELINSKSSMF